MRLFKLTVVAPLPTRTGRARFVHQLVDVVADSGPTSQSSLPTSICLGAGIVGDRLLDDVLPSSLFLAVGLGASHFDVDDSLFWWGGGVVVLCDKI